ncbi:cytochrome c [Halpernia sp.]|uniref:cytochrome c n=1 Tax=Halpernia sp. TaxID=2782209 RepID=UPI003A8D0EE7
MKIYSNHKLLFWTALLFFVFLTLNVCILPALTSQEIYQPLPDSKPLTQEEMAGKKIYVENGCIACHTQQVREVEMDKSFGSRPSIAADYARDKRLSFWQNTATLLGSERTGPDLTNIGARQSSKDWQYLHLYQPRSLVKQSVMPSYRWLFEEKDFLQKGDVEVKVPDEYKDHKFKVIVATKKAQELVAYLLSLKQTPLPKGTAPVEFIYKKEAKATEGKAAAGGLPDGGELFTANCSACHQTTGLGLPGAFPPLKGSPVVLGDNIEMYVTIIMKGYTGRPGYGPMPSVGTTANFTPEMVTAIMNHERSSWGNNAKPVKLEDVKAIMEKIK